MSPPTRSEMTSSVPFTVSREVSKVNVPRSASSETGCSACGRMLIIVSATVSMPVLIISVLSFLRPEGYQYRLEQHQSLEIGEVPSPIPPVTPPIMSVILQVGYRQRHQLHRQ